MNVSEYSLEIKGLNWLNVSEYSLEIKGLGSLNISEYFLEIRGLGSLNVRKWSPLGKHHQSSCLTASDSLIWHMHILGCHRVSYSTNAVPIYNMTFGHSGSYIILWFLIYGLRPKFRSSRNFNKCPTINSLF